MDLESPAKLVYNVRACLKSMEHLVHLVNAKVIFRWKLSSVNISTVISNVTTFSGEFVFYCDDGGRVCRRRSAAVASNRLVQVVRRPKRLRSRHRRSGDHIRSSHRLRLHLSHYRD